MVRAEVVVARSVTLAVSSGLREADAVVSGAEGPEDGAAASERVGRYPRRQLRSLLLLEFAESGLLPL